MFSQVSVCLLFVGEGEGSVTITHIVLDLNVQAPLRLWPYPHTWDLTVQ